MSSPVLASTAYGAIDLNQPGTYLHWSIFTVSVANLVLIGVMVVIFGAALLIPFPKSRTFAPEPAAAPPPADLGSDEDRDMWTNKLRRRALALLPPGKLLPDRQPAYVASWVYVFGVASLAALGMAIVSRRWRPRWPPTATRPRRSRRPGSAPTPGGDEGEVHEWHPGGPGRSGVISAAPVGSHGSGPGSAS